jgi:hypothetical protein
VNLIVDANIHGNPLNEAELDHSLSSSSSSFDDQDDAIGTASRTFSARSRVEQFLQVVVLAAVEQATELIGIRPQLLLLPD